LPGERRLRILRQLVPSEGQAVGTRRLCEVSATVTGLNGAGITVMAGEVNQGSLGASDEVSRTIEELQFALGEGRAGTRTVTSGPCSSPTVVPSGRRIVRPWSTVDEAL
jgi:hypothetical protein